VTGDEEIAALLAERDAAVRGMREAEALVLSHEGRIEVLEAKLALAREALESIARIPSNMREFGESWTTRMATHGAEARDTAREALARLEEK
jgi:hypothetical protein